MEPEEALLGQAVEVVRDAGCEEDYAAVWPLLSPIAPDGPTALRLGTALPRAAGAQSSTWRSCRRRGMAR
jgi:hypothetical protein